MAYAARKDFDIAQGAYIAFRLTIQDQNQDKVDLTGFSAKGTVRKTIAGVDYTASFECTVLDQTMTDTKGSIRCFLPWTAFEDWPLKQPNGESRVIPACPYDIEIQNPSGQWDRPLEGVLNVSPEVDAGYNV